MQFCAVPQTLQCPEVPSGGKATLELWVSVYLELGRSPRMLFIFMGFVHGGNAKHEAQES